VGVSRASVVRTECGTGWQVFTSAGRWYLTVRRYESAREIARELDAQAGAHVDADGGLAEPLGRCQ
jgi:hypothetical protein